jgi:hypothetical protein
MPKTPKKASKETPSVPHSQVVRMADRLHRLSPDQRQGAVERAEARLGKHPSRKDAAIRAAAS